jgi:hypothetical protein
MNREEHSLASQDLDIDRLLCHLFHEEGVENPTDIH